MRFIRQEIPSNTIINWMLNTIQWLYQYWLVITWVKEGPYGLNIKLGPKGIYHYKKQQTGSGPQAVIPHQDDNINYAIDFVTAVGVTIGRLFLDFSYEFELHKTQSTYAYQCLTQDRAGTLSIQQRRNALSFSLGMIF